MTSSAKSRHDRALSDDDFDSDDPYSGSRKKSQHRKTGQLCAQVQRTLAFLLETECSDECLQGFYVESVSPYPNAGCLLVVLRQWNRDCVFDLGEILGRLAELKGYWRTEIGGAINRKRTPDLSFQVVLDGGAP